MQVGNCIGFIVCTMRMYGCDMRMDGCFIIISSYFYFLDHFYDTDFGMPHKPLLACKLCEKMCVLALLNQLTNPYLCSGTVLVEDDVR